MKWISVKDKLPELNEYVLVITDAEDFPFPTIPEKKE